MEKAFELQSKCREHYDRLCANSYDVHSFRCDKWQVGIESLEHLLARSLKSTNVTYLKTYIISLFFSSRRRHTRFKCDWSSDVCSSDLKQKTAYEIQV